MNYYLFLLKDGVVINVFNYSDANYSISSETSKHMRDTGYTIFNSVAMEDRMIGYDTVQKFDGEF